MLRLLPLKDRTLPLSRWAGSLLRSTLLGGALWGLPSADAAPAPDYARDVQPVLREFCFDCHGDGARKGGVAFDAAGAANELVGDHDLWLKVLKNLRGGIMPPPKKPRPSPAQQQTLEHWIKTVAFSAHPTQPDPGRVTVRRLNRVEYRNTVRDLLGVEFDTEKEFPPDDGSHGFDNIGEALTLSPLLLEKYLTAARTIVDRSLPSGPLAPADLRIPGAQFRLPASDRKSGSGETISLSYYEAQEVSHRWVARQAGRYQLHLDFSANERFVENQSDHNKARVTFRVDGRELHASEHGREGGKAFGYDFAGDWEAGEHVLSFAVMPLTPDEKRARSLTIRLDQVLVKGPMAAEHWVRPKNHERFFAPPPPVEAAARRDYARTWLRDFATRAFRRPPPESTLQGLVALAEETSRQSGKTFEAGIGQAVVAVLASPRFLFREEALEPPQDGELFPLLDEFSLASRLSYWLWSSMPDAGLLRLAERRELRKELGKEFARLLANPKSEAFFRNFVGQWLQTRDLESVTIDARQVFLRETPMDPEFEKRRLRFRELRDRPEDKLTPAELKEMDEFRSRANRRFSQPVRTELNGELRKALRQETEKTVEHVFREDRSLLELLESDYTFLNERLAKHYGLTNLNVVGDQLRMVPLPPGEVRGGLLTQGAVLVVTSNPTRTSPVKRGLFVLDNLLGAPPPPPPPDVPPLEDATKALKGQTLSLRQTLALHREQPLCSSCHNRMDPLGLALENFNALGLWRDQERGQPIDASATLPTGEAFTDVRQLKSILARHHAEEFYHAVTEKLLTYALGRGLGYADVDTVDRIVERLVADRGRAQTLLRGVLESAAFQRGRPAQFKPLDPPGQASLPRRSDLLTPPPILP